MRLKRDHRHAYGDHDETDDPEDSASGFWCLKVLHESGRLKVLHGSGPPRKRSRARVQMVILPRHGNMFGLFVANLSHSRYNAFKTILVDERVLKRT